MVDHKAHVEPLLASLGPSSNLRRYECNKDRPEWAPYYARSGEAQHLIEDVCRYLNEAAPEYTTTDALTVATLVSRRITPEG